MTCLWENHKIEADLQRALVLPSTHWWQNYDWNWISLGAWYLVGNRIIIFFLSINICQGRKNFYFTPSGDLFSYQLTFIKQLIKAHSSCVKSLWLFFPCGWVVNDKKIFFILPKDNYAWKIFLKFTSVR